MDLRVRALISGVARDIPVILNVPTVISCRLTCCSVGTWDFPRGYSRAKCEANHLPPSTDFRNECSCISVPLLCLHVGEFVGVWGFVYRGLGETVEVRSVNGVPLSVGAV